MEYFLIIFAAVLIAKLASLSTSRMLFGYIAFLVFLVVTIPAVVRYGIGTDYFPIYTRAIECILAGNATDQEPSYRFVVETIMRFTDEPHWVFIFYSVLTYVVALSAFPRKGFHWAVLIYLLQYYAFTICDIRQGLALSFVIWSVVLYLNRKYWWAVVLGAIAVYWHFSAVAIFPILLVAHYLSKKDIPNFAVILAVLGLLLWVVDISEVFLWLASKTPYAKYLSHPEFIDSAHTSTGLGYLIPAVMFYSVAVTLYCRDGASRVSRQLSIMCGIAFLISVTSLHLEAFRRFSIISDSALPVAMAYLWKKRTSNVDLGCAIFVFLCLFSLFGKEIVSNGGYGVVPYTTIFDEGVQLW